MPAVASLLLAGAVAAGEVELTPLQRAVVDSLQYLNDHVGIEAVVELVDEHLPAARAAGDSAFVMRLVGARGAANTSHHRAARAGGDLRESVELAEALADTASLSRLLLWTARAQEVQGFHEGSLPYYRRLVAIGGQARLPYYEARGLVGLAWDGVTVGEFARAESLYTRAVELGIAAQDSFTILWARNGQGICYWNLGQLARADTAFASVRREGRRRGIAMAEAAALNNHAGLLEVLGRPGEALDGYRRARELNLAADVRREAFPAGMNIARCQLQLGQLDAAVATVESLLAEVREAGFRDLLPAAYEHLAQIRLEQQRPALAARHCREGLAMADVLRPRYEIQLRLALAEALTMQDSLDAALAVTEEAARLPSAHEDLHMRTEIAVTAGSIHMARGEYATAAEVFAAAALDVEAAGMVNHQLTLKSRVGEALLLAERPDAARPWLMDALLVWENARTLPHDPVWRERRSGAARRLFEALAELTLVHPRSDPAEARTRRCFDLLQHFKARTLLERTLGPGRELADPRPVTLRELQRDTLGPGEVFLDCYLGDRRGLVFGVTRDTLLVQVLRGRDAVVAAVDVLQGQIDGPDRAYSRADLANMAVGLTTEIEALPAAGGLAGLLGRAEALTWSPDGALHRVPLSLFFDELGVMSARAPSATFLARLRGRDQQLRPQPARTLAVAGITDGRGGTLPGALREVRWLAESYRNVDAVVDTCAGEAFCGHDPAGYDLIHVAAHAEIDRQRPWNSALLLGTAEQPRRLLAGSVADLDLGARLAVLTSCNSASSAVLSGEGMLGLASGFLSAGVPAVIATLWPVDDRHAEVFSRRFYGELAAGHTAARALQETRAWLRDRPATAHPYHWAGYVLVGEGSGLVPLQEQRTGLAAPIAAGGVLVAAAFTVLARRRRQRTTVKARVRSSPSASTRAK